MSQLKQSHQARALQEVTAGLGQNATSGAKGLESRGSSAQKELAQNLEYNAERLTNALYKLNEAAAIGTASFSNQQAPTSAAGLYGLSERDNWLLSSSPGASNKTGFTQRNSHQGVTHQMVNNGPPTLNPTYSLN